MCGIKWIVLRNENYTGAPVDALEDPVLTSFSRCLEAGLLAVWRRVPRRCLVTYSFDAAGTVTVGLDVQLAGGCTHCGVFRQSNKAAE